MRAHLARPSAPQSRDGKLREKSPRSSELRESAAKCATYLF
jgi:hypothetical protein